MIPFYVIGDSPRLSSGLGRIARDLCGLMHSDTLGLSLRQIGWEEIPHTPWPPPWPLTTFGLTPDWGADRILQILRQDRRPSIALCIWDPSRWYDLMRRRGEVPHVEWWGYFAVDGINAQKSIGGPVPGIVTSFDRVLGYGRWGAGILKGFVNREVEYLPHGLESTWFKPAPPAPQAHILPDALRWIGCVATNQPRKHFPLLVETIADLRRRGHKVGGWLVTDVAVGAAWSMPELLRIHQVGPKHFKVYEGGTLTDHELRALYRSSAATLAIGRGEGFGYPIVESLACGTPAVVIDDAGGAELVPKQEWRIPVQARLTESVYAIERPLVRAEDAANAIERAWGTHPDYCRGAVAHLDWAALWPRWRQWIQRGLEDR